MLPEDRKAYLARQWLEKAQRDLLAAELTLSGDIPLRDVAAFHLQQAAEKALKAYLAWHDRPFRRTHDLLFLVGECEALDASFAQIRDSAALLTPFSTEFRYPGDIAEPTLQTIETAISAAHAIGDFVHARLQQVGQL